MTAHATVPPIAEAFDAFAQETLQFELAARRLDLEDWIVQRLRHPERELTLNLPYTRENGDAHSAAAYRVQHCTWQGPTLGGVRFSPDVHLNQVRAAAMATTWECALFDLPFAGSAGAIICDPQRLSERELRDVTKEYVYVLRGVVGPTTDVFTPDIGSNPQTAAWLFDGFVRAAGHLEPAVVTGKPPGLWGLPAFDDLVARSLYLLIEEVLAERATRVAHCRVAIQGFGKLGAAAARLLHDAGASVVAVADISGGLRNDNGLDVADLQSYVSTNRLMFGFPGADPISNEDVLETTCDLLITAAAEHQVTSANAPKVRAGIVIEAAKETITPDADRILEQHDTLVVPDVLANSTRLFASMIEWSRNQRGICRLDGETESHIKQCILQAYVAVHETAKAQSINLREAAHLLAVDRVASALRLRR